MSAEPLITDPVQIFLIVLAVILFAPLLLNRLKIPHIIGLIVAGVIIGPFGLNIVDNDSSFAVFGQVGLLYLMFLAGLEIDMFHLRLNLKRGIFFGILTLAVPLAAGVLTSVYLFNLDWSTSVLLGSMYASHTLLAYPVAARMGITRAPAVLMAIVGTLIAVIGALVVLGVVVEGAESGEFRASGLLLLALRLGLWAGALLLLYPRVTRFFFKRYPDKVMQYVFVMVMVFLAAVTARLIGLEPVLGAFFAGLILNRYIPAASPLMSSIEFVGNAIFIPYFLIGVGMMINLGVIADLDTIAMSGIMLIVALASKWIPAFIAQKQAGLDRNSRNVLFGLTVAHTAVALAVVNIGFKLHLFDEVVLNSTIVVILITCALAPLITASAASRLKVRMMTEDDSDIIRRIRINNTLISVADSLTAQALVEMAVLMRNDRGKHSFFALHVRNDNSSQSKAISHLSLESAVKTGAAADVKITALDRYDLNTVTGVLNAIEERDITEIIVGMHRRVTVIDSFFGNKIEQLLKSTYKMVILSRCFIPPSTITRIIVWVPQAAQFETGFSRWVRAVSRLAKQIGCRIIYHCAPDTQPLIRGVLYTENYGVRCEFAHADGFDDFILLSNQVLDDDLLIVIGARPQSVSYRVEMAELPAFLQSNFARNNLMMIYPEQFGESPAPVSFTDPLWSDIEASPSPLLQRLKRIFKRQP